MFWGEISCQKKTAQGYLSAFCRSEKYNILQTCPRVQDILHTYQTLNFVTGDTIEQDIKARCVLAFRIHIITLQFREKIGTLFVNKHGVQQEPILPCKQVYSQEGSLSETQTPGFPDPG